MNNVSIPYRYGITVMIPRDPSMEDIRMSQFLIGTVSHQ